MQQELYVLLALVGAITVGVMAHGPSFVMVARTAKSVVVRSSSALVVGKTYTLAKNLSRAQLLTTPSTGNSSVQEFVKDTGVLQPGGSFRSRRGVVITAGEGALKTPIKVFVQTVPASALPVAIPDGIEPIGTFYKVGASPTTFGGGVFTISFPDPVIVGKKNTFCLSMYRRNTRSHRMLALSGVEN